MKTIVHNVEILTSLVERYILPAALKQDPSGLTPSQYNILYYIYTHINVRPRDLAYALNISSPAATYALQRLSGDGFVDIAASNEDKREKSASLSKKGEETVKTISKAKEQLVLDIFNTLSDSAQKELINGLSAFLRSAGIKFGPQKLCLKCGFTHSPNCVLAKSNGKTMEDPDHSLEQNNFG